jgi:hypothetical protein
MKVGYRPVWVGLFLVIGGFLISMALLGRAGLIQLAAGIVCGVAGVLALTRAYFEFDPADRTILLKALLGSKERRFGGAAGGELTVVEDRIVCTGSDGRQRDVPVNRFVARRDDWDAVLARIADPVAGG